MENNRKNTRISIKFIIDIESENLGSVSGETENISFGGMFVMFSSKHEFKSNETLKARIVLQEFPDEISIELTCTPIHQRGNGWGLKFETINAAHYNHFKNVLLAHSKNPDELVEELQGSPGIVIQ